MDWITNSQIIATIQLVSINKCDFHALSITYTNIFDFDWFYNMYVTKHFATINVF